MESRSRRSKAAEPGRLSWSGGARAAQPSQQSQSNGIQGSRAKTAKWWKGVHRRLVRRCKMTETMMVEVVRRKQRHGGHAAKAEQPKQSAPFQGGPTLQTVEGGKLPPLTSENKFRSLSDPILYPVYRIYFDLILNVRVYTVTMHDHS